MTTGSLPSLPLPHGHLSSNATQQEGASGAAFEIHGRVPLAIETRTQDAVVGARFFRPAGEGWSVAESPDVEARTVSHEALTDEIAALLHPLSPR